MRKKIIIKIVTALLFVAVVLCFQKVSFADNFDFNAFDDRGNSTLDSEAESFMGSGVTIIRVAATGIAIIMITYIGIKYMLAAPDEKAGLKKSIAIYVFGAILVFASGNIISIIVDFSTNNIK